MWLRCWVQLPSIEIIYVKHTILFFASDVYSNVTIVHSKFLTIPAFLTLSVNRDEENIREKNILKNLNLLFSKHIFLKRIKRLFQKIENSVSRLTFIVVTEFGGKRKTICCKCTISCCQLPVGVCRATAHCNWFKWYFIFMAGIVWNSSNFKHEIAKNMSRFYLKDSK